MLTRVDPDASMSLRAIADALNDMDIPTVSGRGSWSANSVRRLKMLSKRPYGGVVGTIPLAGESSPTN